MGTSVDTTKTGIGGGSASVAPLQIEDENTVAQRNGTTAQKLYLYNSYIDASNYERAFMRWASNEIRIGAEAAGTGSSRPIVFYYDGVALLSLNFYQVIASASVVPSDRNRFLGGNGANGGNGWATLSIDSTITAPGTTGNRTINKSMGRVNIAAGDSSVTVTCDKVNPNSHVEAVVVTNDATAQIKNVVPGSGTFTINLVSAATAETAIGFKVTQYGGL